MIMTSKYGPEPILDYENGGEDFDHAWYVWAGKHSTEDLEQLVSALGAWKPADDPTAHPDAQMVKYELACQLLAKRTD
jgi:hypothetical protein